MKKVVPRRLGGVGGDVEVNGVEVEEDHQMRMEVVLKAMVAVVPL